MVNAWSLAASVIDGTLDEDYPMYGPEDEQAWVSENARNLPKTDDVTGIIEYPDDVYGYHYPPDGTITFHSSLNNEVQEKESMAHYFKYHEEEILKDIEEYVSSTYSGHYTGTTHEYRNVQTLDLMAARDVAAGFCQANILKYGSRYGSKDGRNKKDLMKVIHYAMLLLHFDDHYGKPSMPSGNFEQMP